MASATAKRRNHPTAWSDPLPVQKASTSADTRPSESAVHRSHSDSRPLLPEPPESIHSPGADCPRTASSKQVCCRKPPASGHRHSGQTESCRRTMPPKLVERLPQAAIAGGHRCRRPEATLPPPAQAIARIPTPWRRMEEHLCHGAADESILPAAMQFRWNSKLAGWDRPLLADRPLRPRSYPILSAAPSKPGMPANAHVAPLCCRLPLPPSYFADQRNSYQLLPSLPRPKALCGPPCLSPRCFRPLSTRSRSSSFFRGLFGSIHLEQVA